MKTHLAVLRKPSVLVATSLGLGLLPWAPGTFGAGAGFLVFALIFTFPFWLQAVIVAVLFAFGCLVCGRAAVHLGQDDPSAVVWDETVGMLIALLFIPHSALSLVAAFVMFRLLDIRKPWPIGLVDSRIGGGLGIMLDDVLVGLGAALSVLALEAGLIAVTG